MEQPGSPQEQVPVQPQEESIFTESDYSLEGYDKHIRRARNMLFFVAVVQLIGLFTITDQEETARYITMGFIILIALIFAGLALWTKKKPYAALLTALILYGSLLILDGVFEPSNLYKGLVLKIGIIVSLISGLRNAKEAEDLKKAFGKD
jgi:UDP-N-acetylmuramyl pentapeptide phosphotransferase/UDP-N-acetylglucosamine-1-phosphate transferase